MLSPTPPGNLGRQNQAINWLLKFDWIQAWVLVLNLKPRTIQYTHLNFSLCVFTPNDSTLGMMLDPKTRLKRAEGLLNSKVTGWEAVWLLGVVSSVWFSRILRVYWKQNSYSFPVGNDCLRIAFLITLWCFSFSFSLCACVCLLLPGPAPEGDQHADSALCLPQQPVDRQRQQQPHHTKPRVVHFHAVYEQVRTQTHQLAQMFHSIYRYI